MKKIVVKSNLINPKDEFISDSITSFLAELDFEIVSMESNFEIHLKRFGEVSFKSISRVFCDIKFEYETDDHFLKKYVEAKIAIFEKRVSNFCFKCGEYKGVAPSETVRHAYCEKCRESFSKEDFKDTIAIGMIGKAGSGKDTVADYIVKNHSFVRVALADPIRDIVRIVFNLDRNNVWDRQLRELPLSFLKKMVDGTLWSVRKLLQFIGTELFRRLIDDKTWVLNLVKRMEIGNNYIISDVRFPNEISEIKENFGGRYFLIKVVRPGYEGKGVGISGHESEAHDLQADIIIQNDGTLEDLYQKIDDVLKSLKGQS